MSMYHVHVLDTAEKFVWISNSGFLPLQKVSPAPSPLAPFYSEIGSP